MKTGINQDLKWIKDNYGEKMMHLCRKYFARILEMPGTLPKILESHFNKNHSLASDIITNKLEYSFKNYIYSFVDFQDDLLKTDKTPEELLSEVGYFLVECKNEEDLKQMYQYYTEDEFLCTFHQHRTQNHYVFFAIKPDALRLQREDFTNPQREDKYSTSVLSIQFTKDEFNTVSIISRYNHSVSNPDATYSNNLENIIPGLTDSFAKKYDLNIKNPNKSNFEIPNYVVANDGKYYKYNYKINDIYYCPGNIIIDNYNVINRYEAKERYIIADYFIIDLKNKIVKTYDDSIMDGFILSLGNTEKIDVINEVNSKSVYLINDQDEKTILHLNKDNIITGYRNDYLTYVDINFLSNSIFIDSIQMDNLKETDEYFLEKNLSLTSINLPKLKKAHMGFLVNNKKIYDVSLPSLITAGDFFMMHNHYLLNADFPKLRYAGQWFLANNLILESIKAPRLKETGEFFLFYNKGISRIELPSLDSVSHEFLSSNADYVLDAPNLEDAPGRVINHLVPSFSQFVRQRQRTKKHMI